MRVLVVHAGPERVAVPANRVCEVVPAVALSVAAGSPPWVVGLARYRGAVIPVVDLYKIATGHPCPERLSARLVIVEVPVGEDSKRMGLLVDRADDLYDFDALPTGDYRPPAIAGQPDLGPLVSSEPLRGVVRVPDMALLGRLAFAPGGSP